MMPSNSILSHRFTRIIAETSSEEPPQFSADPLREPLITGLAVMQTVRHVPLLLSSQER